MWIAILYLIFTVFLIFVVRSRWSDDTVVDTAARSMLLVFGFVGLFLLGTIIFHMVDAELVKAGSKMRLW